MTSRGSSGRPEAFAGQTDEHRPHFVQASWSSSCFQLKSSISEAPISSGEASSGTRGSRTPAFGSRATTFANDVSMCSGFANGIAAMNASARRAWAHQDTG